YRKAIPHFRNAQHTFGPKGSTIANDALLREADCYYMLTDYSKASSIYEQAIQARGAGSDYAAYQKAIIAGISGNTQKKVELLSQLSKNHPTSNYKEEANYQMGKAYMSEGQYAK